MVQEVTSLHQCSYSWMYGLRRIKMLQDRMAAEGYEFVTLNEFDYLSRIANGWKQMSDIPNSISNATTDNIISYPNPTSGILNFDMPISGVLSCYDSVGRLQKTLAVNETKQIDLICLDKGLYFIQVKNYSNKNLLFKVVII